MLRVSNSNGVSEIPVTVSDTAPAIFPSGVTHLNGTLVSNNAPASPGEMLVVYLTGLGRVNGTLATGQPAPVPPLTVVSPVSVDIGTLSVSPTFAGLAPGFAGVYQVNVSLPPDLATNAYPLRVVSGGNLSNVMSIAVRAR
jgi:uncharacterized protein (TIGR03437 family)